MGCCGIFATARLVILELGKGAAPVRDRLACSAACRFKTPAKVIRGGHGTLTCLDHARCDGTGVQQFQCSEDPAGSDGAGLSLKYRRGTCTCWAVGERTTLHATMEFRLPVRSVSFLLDIEGHVRSDVVLTDGSHRQASNLKMVGLAAIQLVIFSLSAAPMSFQAVCLRMQPP